MFWRIDPPLSRAASPVRKRRSRSVIAAAAAAAAAIVAGGLALAPTRTAAAGDAVARPAGADGGSVLMTPPVPPPCDEPLCYSASRLEAERNHIILSDIQIVDTTRGTTQIKADRAEATGLDLGNSRWVLTGHVQVYMPQGQLQASDATVQFTDKHIASIAAAGAPAAFAREVTRGPAAPPINVTGHAQQITYDVALNQVQLTGNSWLTDGCNDISTQQITYDIASQRVQAAAGAGGGGRVHGTIGARGGAPCTSGAGRP